MNVSDEALESYINNLIHISSQTFRNIATSSKQGRQNTKGWTKQLWAEVDTLLARDDPVVAKVIQEAAELSREEGIGRKRGCLLTMNS